MFARSSTDFVAGFHKVKCRFRGRAAFSQGEVQVSWQGQHFRKGKCRLPRLSHRFRGRNGTFAKSIADSEASAALSQGQVQISWQAQHFRKFRYR